MNCSLELFCVVGTATWQLAEAIPSICEKVQYGEFIWLDHLISPQFGPNSVSTLAGTLHGKQVFMISTS